MVVLQSDTIIVRRISLAYFPLNAPTLNEGMSYCWRVCLAWYLSDISLLEKNHNKRFSFVYMVTFSLLLVRKFSLGETKRK